MNWGTARFQLTTPMVPGEQRTFSLTTTMPSTTPPGSYSFLWRMAKDGVAFFGDATGNRTITVAAPALVNRAEFVSQIAPPSTLVQGKPYSYSVSMKNTGTTTWDSAGASPHRLGAINSQDVNKWGANRLTLAAPVAPGAVGTFSYSGLLPLASATGTFDFQWQMLQDGVEWFGKVSDNSPVIVTAAPFNGAEFVSQVTPPQGLVQGQAYSYSVTYRNTGNTTWSSDGTTPFRLVAIDPQNLVKWGVTRLSLPAAVAPGGLGTFSYSGVMPSNAATGAFNFQWQLVQESAAWAGPLSTNVPVSIVAASNGAQFVSQVLPPLIMAPGRSYSYSITMRNTGTTTWDSGTATPQLLAAIDPQNLQKWGTNRLTLAAPVAPNGVGTFSYTAVIPVGSVTGTFAFQWQMIQETVGSFGPVTTQAMITIALPGQVEYLHTDALGSPIARTNQNGVVVSRTRYEPYGGTALGTVPTIGFTGHVNDAETGLVYMQQRYYDPVAGRFLSIDPVTTDANTGGSFNRYVYAANNPYKYIDPDGRKVVIVGTNEFKKEIRAQLKEVRATAAGSEAYDTADASKEIFTIKAGTTSEAKPNSWAGAQTPGVGSGGTLFHNTTATPKAQTTAGPQAASPKVVLGHELSHIADFARGTDDPSAVAGTTTEMAEFNAVGQENRMRQEWGFPKRVGY
jgi:RHS repeat-associated protein